VSLCLALSSRGGLLLGGLLLGGFFLAVSSWRFRPLLGGKPARPAQPSQRRRRSVLPPVPVHCDRLHLELVAARAREMFCHSQIRLYALPVCGVRFLRPRFLYLLRTCPARPIRAHTCSAITRRLCGWLGASGTQDLRALRLWQSCRQWRAQPHAQPSVELHGCCARVSLAAALLSQHVDDVARAGSAGTKSGSSARSLRTARFGVRGPALGLKT
jgi:hypothetical protein